MAEAHNLNLIKDGYTTARERLGGFDYPDDDWLIPDFLPMQGFGKREVTAYAMGPALANGMGMVLVGKRAAELGGDAGFIDQSFETPVRSPIIMSVMFLFA